MPAVACSQCGAKFKIEKPGRYACTKCGAALALPPELGGGAAAPQPAAAPVRPAAGKPAGPPPAGRSAGATAIADPIVEQLEAAIAADPVKKDPYLQLAQHQLERGQKDQAIATYQRFLQWVPGDAFVQKRLAALQGAAPAAATPAASPAGAPSPLQQTREHNRKAMLVGGGVAALLVLLLFHYLLRPILFPSIKPVVRNQWSAFGPVWSPDGKRIAYISVKDPGSFLAVYDFQTDSVRDLVASSEKSWPPHSYAFSPDGSEIAYETRKEEGGKSYPWVYRVAVAGGEPRLVARGRDPSWSHDGRSVIMMCSPEAADTPERVALESYVCAVEVTTSDILRLSDAGTSNPAPDPTSGQVVYQVNLPPRGGDREDEFWQAVAAAKREGKNMWEMGGGGGDENAEKGADGRFRSRWANDLFLVGTDGSGRTRLTEDGRSSQPSWSPDGKRVLFMYSAVGAPRADVWVMDPDGGNRTRALGYDGLHADDSADLRLLPDGKRLMYRSQIREVDGGVGSIVVGNIIMADLYLVPIGGTNPVRLASKHSFKGRFTVAPDGKRVAYEHVDKDTSVTHIWWTRIPD